jgi:extradiol dioxygenase family protein
MSNRFHLAIPGGDLSKTLPFYTDILGCKLDMAEEGKWQDVDFWGNELTIHATTHRTEKSPERERHSVDMGEVCVPHFGVHLKYEDYMKVRESVENTVGFLDKPYTRFESSDYQQETFFVEDPNFNVLEIKSMAKDGS